MRHAEQEGAGNRQGSSGMVLRRVPPKTLYTKIATTSAETYEEGQADITMIMLAFESNIRNMTGQSEQQPDPPPAKKKKRKKEKDRLKSMAPIDVEGLENALDNVPAEFCCPINSDIMRNPFIANDGRTYDRKTLEQMTARKQRGSGGIVLKWGPCLPNMSLRERIEEWVDSQRKRIKRAKTGGAQHDPIVIE
jgi:hypothetical protein